MSTPKKNVTTIRLAPGVATRRSYNHQKHTSTERRRLFEAVLVLDLDALGRIAAGAALSKGLQSSVWGGASALTRGNGETRALERARRSVVRHLD